MDKIYWGGEFDVIKRLLESGSLNNSNIRFFLGYSGWQSHQLEDEMADNAWVVAEISARGDHDPDEQALLEQNP